MADGRPCRISDYMGLRAYIAAHPSRHPSGLYAGSAVALPDFLCRHAAAFNGSQAVTDMALEWGLHGRRLDGPNAPASLPLTR
jgi:hypothetical protein